MADDTATVLKDKDNGLATIYFALCLCRNIDPQVIYVNPRDLRRKLVHSLALKSFATAWFLDSSRDNSGTKYVQKPTFYCHCNLLDLQAQMICCSNCKSWYHYEREYNMSNGMGMF